MPKERIKYRSLCGQGQRLPKSYRKYLRRKLAEANDDLEYQRWLERRRQLLKRLGAWRS